MKQAIKTTETKFNNFVDFGKRFPDEQSCREYLAQARWNGEPICSHCGYSEKVYRINDGKLYKCAKCRKQFTVRVGSIFEDSPLPLQKWFMAIYILTAHRKGISSCQLARDIEVTQKTAWHMLHKIRYAIKTKSFNKPLNGIVEIDETFVGGKSHGMGGGYTQPNKTAVFGMLERKGEVRAQPVSRVCGDILKPIIRQNISPDATIMSDEFSGYRSLKNEFKNHEVVVHSKKEYVRGDVSTNNIEAFWSLMKRGIFGTYHKVDKKHLHQYTDEFMYRYNSRKIKDIERFHEFFNHCSGRLTYQELID
jgi:transposase-like protein